MSSVAVDFQHALANHQSGDLAAAEGGYRRVLARAPRDINALYHLGIVLHQQGKAEDARQVLGQTLDWAPDFPEACFSLGVVLIDLKRYEEAEAVLRRAVALRPQMQKALSRLGELLVTQEKYQEALSPLRTALLLQAYDAKAADALVAALRRLGLLEEGVEVSAGFLGLGRAEHDLRMAESIYLLHRSAPELARPHAERWIATYPENPYARHVAAGVLGLEAPDRAHSDYVKGLFDGFAATFEQQLFSVGYRPAELVADILAMTDAKAGLVVLDAGCGTGLASAALRPCAARLVGVDLSPRMLDKAREKGAYDELVEMDLEAFLRGHPATFDLIVAADVFNYFGELRSILGDAAVSLRPAGWLAFTLERADVPTFALGAHGRYSHNKDYVVDLIRQAGVDAVIVQDKVLRHEFGKAVEGLLIAVRKPG